MEEVKVVPWIRFVPNALSGVRLLLAVLFPLASATWRLPVVLGGAVTDWLDGLIARRFQVASPLGGILDAVADKGFALSVLFTLAAEDEITAGEAVLVLVRDFVVGFVALYYAIRRNWRAFTGMPSRLPGKLATVLVFAWFVVLVWPGADDVRRPLFLATAALSVLAGVDYFARFLAALVRPPA